MLRLFIAIELPSTVKEMIQNMCYDVRHAHWVSSDLMHLTLRFIGEVNTSQFHTIIESLEEIDFPSFSLVASGIGFFSSRKKPTILWVGLRKSDALINLYNKIGSQLKKIEIPVVQEKKFHPHITIARMSQKAQFSDITPFITQYNLFITPEFQVSQFHLFSSVLNKQGAIHQIEESFLLEK